MDGLTPRQLSLMAFAGLAAPMTMLCAGLPWPSVLLGLAAGGLGFQVLHGASGRGARMPEALRGGYLLWCLLLLARALGLSSLCFQSRTACVPVVLLALAAAASYGGAETCGRLGAVLWPVLAALLGGLLAFALSDVRWTRVAAARTGGETEWMGAAAVGLSLSVAWILARSGRDARALRRGYWMAAALGFAAAMVAGGMLGRLQRVVDQPLYDMARGVNVLGVPQRLEALLSAGLCAGYFMTLGVLCTCASALARPLMKGKEGWTGLLVAIAALALWRPAEGLPTELWLLLSLGLGVAVPAAGAVKTIEKKRKRSKKLLDNGEGS